MIAVLMCAAMATTTFTGCGKLEVSSGVTLDDDDVTDSESVISEDFSKVAETDADEPEGENLFSGGGKPWVDSDLKSNLLEDK